MCFFFSISCLLLKFLHVSHCYIALVFYFLVICLLLFINFGSIIMIGPYDDDDDDDDDDNDDDDDDDDDDNSYKAGMLTRT